MSTALPIEPPVVNVRRKIRLSLLRRDPHCRYCGGPVSKKRSQVDHLRPKCQGGTDDRRNLVLVCGTCNYRKGDLTPLQLALWTGRVLAVWLMSRVRKDGAQ